jgi:hypothetical protein
MLNRVSQKTIPDRAEALPLFAFQALTQRSLKHR